MVGTTLLRKEEVIPLQYKDLMHGYLAATTSQIATLLAEVSRTRHERHHAWNDFQDVCSVLKSRLSDLRNALNPRLQKGAQAKHLLDDIIEKQLWALPDDFARAGLATDRPGLPMNEARTFKILYIERLKTILRALDMVERVVFF